MTANGSSAKFLAPAKKRLVIGVLQTRFLTLSSSHFDPFQTSAAAICSCRPVARDRCPSVDLIIFFTFFFTWRKLSASDVATAIKTLKCNAGHLVHVHHFPEHVVDQLVVNEAA